MTDLLAAPTHEQQLLLDCLAKAYRDHNEWPYWQFVEHELSNLGLGPEAVIRSLPELGMGSRTECATAGFPTTACH